MPYAKYTLLQMKSKLRSRMGNAVFWTDAELKFCLNEALRVWNLMTWQYRSRSTVLTVANQTYYDTSSFLNVTRVVYNGLPMGLTSLFALDQLNPGWEPQTGTPIKWFPVGATKIGIYPADAVANNTMVVEGLAPAPQLSLDTDYIDLGEWQFRALADYVEHIACFKQGGKEFEDSMEFYKSFVRAAGVQNSKLQLSGIYRRAMGMDLEEGQRPQYESQQPSNGNA